MTAMMASRPTPATAVGVATGGPTFATPTNLNPQQAWDVALVVDVIGAYNARQLDAVLAVLADDIGWSDCDYRRIRYIMVTGKAQLAHWLRQRFTRS